MDELRWARAFARSCPKNFQVWHHRQALVVLLGDPSGELDHIIDDFQGEPKNYHAWQYRQWILKRFGGSIEDELRLVDELIRLDPYNNSAWNHRYFVHFGSALGALTEKSAAWFETEANWVRSKLSIDPTNASPQNYLDGLMRLKNHAH